jgi:hypothetical protein
MATITHMIDHQRNLIATRSETARLAREADEACRLGEAALVAALVEASGRKLGDIITTVDKREGKIVHFRLATEGFGLVARCQGKTKAGQWSDRLNFLCAIGVPTET